MWEFQQKIDRCIIYKEEKKIQSGIQRINQNVYMLSVGTTWRVQLVHELFVYLNNI